MWQDEFGVIWSLSACMFGALLRCSCCWCMSLSWSRRINLGVTDIETGARALCSHEAGTVPLLPAPQIPQVPPVRARQNLPRCTHNYTVAHVAIQLCRVWFHAMFQRILKVGDIRSIVIFLRECHWCTKVSAVRSPRVACAYIQVALEWLKPGVTHERRSIRNYTVVKLNSYSCKAA